ncbi:uncharacterized protein [Littorina saxatilis]|uniref:Uncharacterized protein n=1 Tax=Littorina saxatilis TaxID=31220 RepID=A0AAN9GQP7_9CAEN
MSENRMSRKRNVTTKGVTMNREQPSSSCSPMSAGPQMSLTDIPLKAWYPRWNERAHFVPPVLMFRTDYDTMTVAGVDVRVPRPPVRNPSRGDPPAVLNTDVIDDQTQQRVLHCLRHFSEEQQEPEVMFVLSNLRFEDYLNEPCFAAAAKTLPRPVDLKKQEQDRGDFDVLIIHRVHGILACEIKSVSARNSSQPMTEQKVEKKVKTKVDRAIKQLVKSGDVLKHLVSDIPGQIPIRKALILPNVSATQLTQVLNSSPQLLQDLRQCLGVAEDSDPVPLCLTSDGLSDTATPHLITRDVLLQLRQWWNARVVGVKTASLSDDLYLNLLTRFAGPATVVKVFCSVRPHRRSMDLIRTEGEAALETRKRFTQIMLTHHQVKILQRNRQLVFLTGPPGVGKTIMLVLKAKELVRAGMHVDVVSSWGPSLTMSHSIVHQLKQMEPAAADRVHLHEFDLREGQAEDTAVRTLVEASNSRQCETPCIIADEVCCDSINASKFEKLVDQLLARFPNLIFWAACFQHKYRPTSLIEEKLTQALRSPPSVVREVQASDLFLLGDIYRYTEAETGGAEAETGGAEAETGGAQSEKTLPCQPHCDGPAPCYMSHEGEGHETGRKPRECIQCGRDVARVLTEDLHVGVAVAGTTEGTHRPSLRYLDVLVLTSFRAMSDSAGFVVGLRQGGLPVSVLRPRDSAAAASVATASKDDRGGSGPQ